MPMLTNLALNRLKRDKKRLEVENRIMLDTLTMVGEKRCGGNRLVRATLGFLETQREEASRRFQ